ncbi:DoxX family protein [Antrihabitans stalactiti]|uniref:DoxX family protein n=1 Tax=Antrihabitans stalactiti TaxID=2584121 RepID=A0A848KB37_9NOCA|nr:DoxX family protein [Antrihabitans stalactiti]NMN95519.1 DoxX family protein [Antrihabitans stalactiti]
MTLTQIAAAPATNGISRKARRVGTIMGGLVVAFLTVDAIAHLLNGETSRKGFLELGVPAHLGPISGIAMLIFLALLLFRPTAVIGAIFVTGYLSSVVSVHLINENPIFSHVLFPVYLGILLWTALYLRDERVPALVGR